MNDQARGSPPAGRIAVSVPRPAIVGRSALPHLPRSVRRFNDRLREWSLPYRHYLSAGRRALPDFIVIGSMKSSTTSMFHYLNQHPDIAMSPKKEIHFFDRHYAKGERWYRAHFPYQAELQARAQRAGEITPSYILHPEWARRIQQTVPTARLVLMMRNPVDRTYSHYHHNRHRNLEHRDFWSAIDNQADNRRHHDALLAGRPIDCRNYLYYSYLERGFYIDLIEGYLKYFPRSQMHFVIAEDMRHDGQAIMDEVCRFIGVPPQRFDMTRKHHVSKRRDGLTADERARLDDRFADANRRLAAFLGRELPW